mmetsp:Transcript_9437/g.28399  ORF Transcript_9437/g.28399 Transcript_9437/m.28399 type:complete len:286 (-) Transcript_9437:1868-2725(-)
MDAKHLQARLRVEHPKVVLKAEELVRLSTTRCPPGTLRQGELCRQAVCFELACNMLGTPVNHGAIVLHSGVKEPVYNKSLALMQKLLGIKNRVSAKDLCVQFGCVRLEQTTQQVLSQYKERYLRGLSPADRMAADFSRPTFVAAAFFLAARKAKLRVDKGAMLARHNIPAADFASVATSMTELCFDAVGTEAKKRKADSIKTNRELLDLQQGFDEGGSGASSADDGSDGEGAVHAGEKALAKRQRQKGYDDWKENVTANAKKTSQLPLNKLKQATLSFGRKADPP